MEKFACFRIKPGLDDRVEVELLRKAATLVGFARNHVQILVFLLFEAAFSSGVASAQAALDSPYRPRLPDEISKSVESTLNLGLSGHSFEPPPSGLEYATPPAKDSMTFSASKEGLAQIAVIKVANNKDYQLQDLKNGVSVSELKTRAEFSTMDLRPTHYGEGDSRVYRVAVRLHDSWYWDDRVAIFTQFKRMSAGPDMFVGIKRHDIVLRVGRTGESNASQTVVVSNVALGQWIEIILSVNWSVSDAGKISVYYRYNEESNYHRIRDVVGKNLEISRSSAKKALHNPDAKLCRPILPALATFQPHYLLRRKKALIPCGPNSEASGSIPATRA